MSFLRRKIPTSRSSIDTPFPQSAGEACPRIWLKTSSAWPTTTSSMVLKYKVMVRKGSKRYIGTGCLFSLFFALMKSFLCRLDQTKGLQSIHTLQQTFSPRFETLTMQVGLEKHKNMEKVDPLYTCYGFGRENTDQSVIYRHNVPQTAGEACLHAGLAQDLSNLAYNNEQHGSKGPNDGPEGVQTVHWYRVSVFHLFLLSRSHSCADWIKPRVYKAYPRHSKRFCPGLKP